MRNLKTNGEEKGHWVVFGVEGDVDELCHEGFDNTSHKRGELTWMSEDFEGIWGFSKVTTNLN